MPTEITSGTMNCTAETPRLPSPAFSPSAEPLHSFGKKKLMFAMLELKLPPPRPHRTASASMTQFGVVGFWTARPMLTHGISSESVEITVQRWPPTIDRHHERIEDAQRRAAQRRERRQPEQFIRRVLEARGRKLNHDRAPHHPHGEGEKQRGDRDPQVQVRDGAAFLLPEGFVFGRPDVQDAAGARSGRNRLRRSSHGHAIMLAPERALHHASSRLEGRDRSSATSLHDVASSTGSRCVRMVVFASRARMSASIRSSRSWPCCTVHAPGTST
jgi:hypothetical protein